MNKIIHKYIEYNKSLHRIKYLYLSRNEILSYYDKTKIIYIFNYETILTHEYICNILKSNEHKHISIFHCIYY